MKKLWVVLLITILSISIRSISHANECDRACLEGIADQYLAAMVAHDASKAPFADNVIFTENTIKLPLTEGLWFTASGMGDFKIYICDLKTGQVAWVGGVKEHNKPVILSLRLKVINRQITEAESIVIRDIDQKNIANFKLTEKPFTEFLAPSDRVSRDEMANIPELYFNALKILDDKDVPFADECYRLENGMVTAGTFPGAPKPPPGMPSSSKCRNGKISPMLKTIYSVTPRRTPVVDEEKGITWGIYCFNHRGLASVEMPDGTTQPTYFNTPNSMPVSEIFHTRKGKIIGIWGLGSAMPYGIGDGWIGPVYK
ncbi:MAG: hypothetical protein JW927_11460 [Deltaproteobacteria bacterium]|nr:hypothetical protein [Deltaproteobacteria bacterium]